MTPRGYPLVAGVVLPVLVSLLACTCGGDSAKVLAMQAMCPGPSMDPASSTVIGSACMELGLGYNNGLYGAVDKPEARKYYRWGCDVNSEGSCFNLGRMEEKGEGGEVDLVKALAHYEQSCHLGYDDGCAAAFMLNDDAEILVEPCERDHRLSCYRLAITLVDSAPERAAALHEEGCADDYPSSCFSHAVNLVFGRGRAAETSRGMALLESQCETGFARSCTVLGGVSEGTDDKRRYLEKACEMNDGPGCIALADISEGERAVLLREKACELGIERGCAP